MLYAFHLRSIGGEQQQVFFFSTPTQSTFWNAHNAAWSMREINEFHVNRRTTKGWSTWYLLLTFSIRQMHHRELICSVVVDIIAKKKKKTSCRIQFRRVFFFFTRHTFTFCLNNIVFWSFRNCIYFEIWFVINILFVVFRKNFVFTIPSIFKCSLLFKYFGYTRPSEWIFQNSVEHAFEMF